MELKVGDRVEVVKSTIEDLNGMFGVIKGKGDGWHWWVTLEGGSQSLGFDTRELAPATEQPAPAVEPSAFAQAAQGDDTLAVALYEAAALRTELASVRSQLAAAQAERDAYKTALKPFAELYRDWLVNRNEIEFFDYLNRYRVSDELLANVMNASVVIQEALQATE